MRLVYEVNAGAVKTRKRREEMEARGVRIGPEELLDMLLAEGMDEDEAQERATRQAEAIMREKAERGPGHGE